MRSRDIGKYQLLKRTARGPLPRAIRTSKTTRMPFSLANALTTFQKTLNILVSEFNWRTCLIYMDSVIVFSKSFETHLKDVDMVHSTLQKKVSHSTAGSATSSQRA